MKLLDKVKRLLDTKTLTHIIIFCIILFAIIYLWQTKEGFAQYNVNEGDYVTLPDLQNVLVGTRALPDKLNDLIDTRYSTSFANMYAKTSDMTLANANITSNAALLSTVSGSVNTLQTNVSDLRKDLTDMQNVQNTNKTTLNTRIDDVMRSLNNNISSNVGALSSRIKVLEDANYGDQIMAMSRNVLQYIGGFNWAPLSQFNIENNNPSLGFTYNTSYLLFNWNDPTSINPSRISISADKMVLPTIQPNTYYFIMISFSHWCAVNSISKIYCVDPNNGNSKTISNINNNNSFYWNNVQHLSFTHNFVVKTSVNNPNIAIYINSSGGLAQDMNDKFSISIFKINNPSNTTNF